MGYPSITHYRDCREADPVNLIFPDVNVGNIVSYLQGIGWRLPMPKTAENLFLKDCRHSQDWQLVYGNLVVRHHLRVWKYSNSVAVGNVHFEILSLGRQGHVVVEHESAEKLVFNMLTQAGKWNVTYDAIYLENSRAHPYNDGLATHIG